MAMSDFELLEILTRAAEVWKRYPNISLPCAIGLTWYTNLGLQAQLCRQIPKGEVSLPTGKDQGYDERLSSTEAALATRRLRIGTSQQLQAAIARLELRVMRFTNASMSTETKQLIITVELAPAQAKGAARRVTRVDRRLRELPRYVVGSAAVTGRMLTFRVAGSAYDEVAKGRVTAAQMGEEFFQLARQSLEEVCA